MSEIKLHINLFKHVEEKFEPSEQVCFTKPAQLTKIRDILALYATGQIAPTLKTLPGQDTFCPESPYSNIQEAQERYRAKVNQLNNAFKQPETAQNPTNDGSEVPAPSEGAQSAEIPSTEVAS